jgi:hypothetical protein
LWMAKSSPAMKADNAITAHTQYEFQHALSQNGVRVKLGV